MSDDVTYPPCRGCKYVKVSKWFGLFTSKFSWDYARCVHPEIIKAVSKAEDRYHLGKKPVVVPTVKFNDLPFCRLERSTRFPQNLCGPTAKLREEA